MNIAYTIATELSVNHAQVESAINLLEEGATVPFIARYRKEATGGLDDTALRQLQERYVYLTELVERQQVILKSIEEQGKLTETLKKDILAAESKTRLEDLYLPYKPKRRTKAQIAKEAGLEPLAELLRADLTVDVELAANDYIDDEKGVADVKAALEGARYILMETVAEDADSLQACRELMWQHGEMMSKVAPGKEEDGEKFADYFEYNELVHKMPSHRILAVFRGRKEGYLHLNIRLNDEAYLDKAYRIIADFLNPELKPAADSWMWQTVEWVWKIKLQLKLELDLMAELKQNADESAIGVFRDNLHHLLMAAPAGNKVVLGLDPGFRTGVKTVVVDGTGKLLAHTVVYPHPPQKQWDAALATLAKLCQKHAVELISIGNGTASRETDQLAAELVKAMPALKMTKIVVSEAGASVYSASELAAKEFPDLDVSYRGAVSIARRLQDPLAELVKIEPKSIGVGQYQHDVNQVKLDRSLGATVEDCVNAVGADINTASVPLLTSIAGLNERIAANIVLHREQQGRFADRQSIKKVVGLGEKTFEQAAGFLRIIDGKNPLDRSAVHPESYAIVQNMVDKLGKPFAEILGNEALLNSLNPMDFVTESAGLMTVRDIIDELKKPGRDPRPEFKMATFTDGINEVSDLKVGMKLEGVITNVANFGAFVDIGVHQDGLVHVSQIADHFVKDLHQEVKVGQIVQVRVLEVDVKRKRISLTMKSEGAKQPGAAKKGGKAGSHKSSQHDRGMKNNPFESALSQQLKSALQQKR